MDHFCAFKEIDYYIDNQQKTCMKPAVEKYFKGSVLFRVGYDIQYSKIITEDMKKTAMLSMLWQYYNNITTISEEKLVYGPKDLLAWLGGALGIFVGYSFFDFAKHLIDVTFYFFYRKIGAH